MRRKTGSIVVWPAGLTIRSSGECGWTGHSPPIGLLKCGSAHSSAGRARAGTPRLGALGLVGQRRGDSVRKSRPLEGSLPPTLPTPSPSNVRPSWNERRKRNGRRLAAPAENGAGRSSQELRALDLCRASAGTRGRVSDLAMRLGRAFDARRWAALGSRAGTPGRIQSPEPARVPTRFLREAPRWRTCFPSWASPAWL